MSDNNLLAFLDEELNELKKAGLYHKLRILSTAQQPVAVIDGKKVINLSSNNYLGLTTHPKVIEAAIEYTRKYGTGTAAVRTIIGTMDIHEELERKIAKFKGTEAALVFQSGFTTNVAIVQALMSSEDDFLISDELNHASIIDGARLSKAKRGIYQHKNMKELEKLLQQAQGSRRILIVTDGVFSMDGDIAPLPEITTLAEKYGAIVMVDDAHASGVLGRNGRGTVDHFGLHGKVHIQIGTLSKAIGSLGGYAAIPQKLREFLIHKARPFLFSSSHPPAVVGACTKAFDLLLEEPEIIEKLWENTNFFKKGLRDLGFNTGESETPITPVITGSTESANELSRKLFEEGVFVQSIAYPLVPKGKERVRTIVTAGHSIQDLEFALDKFKKVGKQLGLI